MASSANWITLTRSAAREVHRFATPLSRLQMVRIDHTKPRQFSSEGRILWWKAILPRTMDPKRGTILIPTCIFLPLCAQLSRNQADNRCVP